MNKSYMTVASAAEYLDVSQSTMRRWHNNGLLSPDVVDLNTRYRYYSKETLDTFRDARYSKVNKADYQEIQFSFDFIDLFAGIGGIRTAFEQAGGKCVFSSEIDPFACVTYEYIFGDKPDGDINKIPSNEIPQHDILLGGFPCQPFSLAGVSKYNSLGLQNGFDHPTKGTLFFEIARILDYHHPKAFLLENVKNLRTHNKGETWKVIKETLETDLGYTIYDKIIDARYLVPQHRERIYIVGFREPLAFEWPEIPDRKPKIKDILSDNPDSKYTLSDHLWSYLKAYAQKHKEKGNGFGYGLAPLDGIARTLSARYHKDGSEILIPQDGKNPRRLSPAECARLMGFPEKYEHLPVSDTQAYRQFGNSVVVPVVEAIAKQIVKTLARHAPTESGLVAKHD